MPKRRNPTTLRDELECALIGEAIARDLPLLAICRGIQILNVQHGGTLVQHLDSTKRHRPAHGRPGAARASNRNYSRDAAGGHRRGCAPCVGCQLHATHQAIARVGDGLRVSARDAEDGTIEAVERPDKRFVVGVEWHPENMSAADERQARLFQAFAEAL